MRFSRTSTSLVAVAVLSGTAFADLSAENAVFAGARTIDLMGNDIGTPRGGTTVFSNLQSGFTANAAFSSTDLGAVWGDQLALAGTGTLESFSFAIFNSGSSAGALTSAVVDFAFFRASDSSSLGGFSVNTGDINLNAGFFTTLTVGGLGGFGVDLDTTDVIVLQTVTSTVGAANRLGVISATPASVGTSIPQLYIQASTVGGGVAGFYNITSAGAPISFNVGYELVVPTPGSMALLGMGGLFASRRRR